MPLPVRTQLQQMQAVAASIARELREHPEHQDRATLIEAMAILFQQQAALCQLFADHEESFNER